jgi:predicted SAM-dependent methyltransferase
MRQFPIVLNVVRRLRKYFGNTPEVLSIRFHQKRSTGLVEDYFQKNSLKKIQIGAQSNFISGWLNVDLIPKSLDVVFMDATKTFPFPSNSIDYIYTEHMIEHISFSDAKFMLSECFRVLKKSGRIRVATPNLEFLINLYRDEKNKISSQYIDFSVQRYLKNQTPREDVYVINNFFRDWGHQFIHDYKSLSFLLMASGFEYIKRCNIQESEDPTFQNLEQHGKEIGDEFNKLETLVVEAKKV